MLRVLYHPGKSGAKTEILQARTLGPLNNCFEIDAFRRGKFHMTFNPGGYLKRVK